MGLLKELLKEHIGNRVEIVQYGNGADYSLEDLETDEVIFDTDIYELEEAKPQVIFREKMSSPYGSIEDTVEVERYGHNDYVVYFVDADYSVRGNLLDIIHEIVNVFYNC